MNPTELSAVFTTNNVAEAEILRAMLESEGVSCELEGQHQASLTGLLDIRGLVRAEDEDRARKVLGPHAHHRVGDPSHPPKAAGHFNPQVGVAHPPSSRQYNRKSDRS